MTLGEYLKSKKLTQEAFGELVGLDRHRVCHLVAGDYRPGLDLALRIEGKTEGKVTAASWVAKKRKQR